MAVVLDEIVDDTYEPSPQEINEYAEYLGMDLTQDHDLLWIAKDGLKAPLPGAWKPCRSGDGEIFYFNFETGESVWDHPSDENYRKVYRRSKARRDAPKKLVTISGSCEDGSELTVRCQGSLNGDDLGVLNVRPTLQVQKFQSLLAKNLEVSKRNLRIILPDGRLLSDEDSQMTLVTALDIDCPSSVEEDDKAYRRRHRKERRAYACLERCQHLGGLATGGCALPADAQQPNIGAEEELSGFPGLEDDSWRAATPPKAGEDSPSRAMPPLKKAPHDAGVLKSVILNHANVVHRQRPQSLKLCPLRPSTADDQKAIG
jgi:centrosomal protein CEP164